MQHPSAISLPPTAACNCRASGFRPQSLGGMAIRHNMCGAAITGAFIMTQSARFICSRANDRIRRISSRRSDCRLPVQRLADFSDWRRSGQNGCRSAARNSGGDGRTFPRQDGRAAVDLANPTSRKAKSTTTRSSGMLSMLTYKRWNAGVRGLDAFPSKTGREHPCSITATTSWWSRTFFVAVMVVALFLL